eukprot:gene19481-25365_t
MTSNAKSSLDGKVYLITGSSDGIGIHPAKKIANDGATVLLHAPYKITSSLLPLLKSTPYSRVRNVASTSQEEGDPHIILDNLQFQSGGYSDHASYSLSKLCMAALSYEYAKRIIASADNSGVLINSCDPGDVDTQMLRAGWPGYLGMPLNEANDEYKLSTCTFDESMHGPKEHRRIWRAYMGFFGAFGGVLCTEQLLTARFKGILENQDLVSKYGSITHEEFLRRHNKTDQNASDLTDDGL